MNKIILYSVIIISIATFQLWEYFKIEFGVSIFYIGYAFCFLLLSFLLYKKSSKEESYPACVLLILSCNNFIEELFFTPYKENCLELLIAVIVVIITLKKNETRI